MKLCGPHWSELRSLIEASGYGSLIAADDNDAKNRLAKELEDSAGPDDFDPLMAAQNLILGNAVDAAGPALLAPVNDGSDRCPICFLNVPEWLAYAARDAIEDAKAISLGPAAAHDGGSAT